MVMVRQWRQRFLRPRGGHAAVVVFAALATGCKTGSWGAKPSWWGSTGPGAAASSLTAAPSFEADPTKPSEVAKPYPTTSTPEGYALDAAAKPAATQTAASSLVEPAAVTYGTTVAARAEQPEQNFQPISQPAAGVGPQVGPYASLEQPVAAPAAAGSDPAAAAMAGFGAAPAFDAEAPPAATPPGPPAARMADARGSAAWPAASGSAPMATQPADAATDGRYGSMGSRFSGGFAPAAATAAAAQPAFDPAPAMPANPAADPLPLSQPIPPAASPVPAAALPGGMAPPTRRPDPGYRPGGTSSYRPNRAILAEDEPGTGPIQPVAYDLPAAAR